MCPTMIRTNKTRTVDTRNTGIEIVRRRLSFREGIRVFSQGALADAIFLIQAGTVRITVLSAFGKQVRLRVLGPDDFLGEESLVSGSLRTTTATSMEPSIIFRIETAAMMNALHLQPEFRHSFLASLLTRTLNLERDLCGEYLNGGI